MEESLINPGDHILVYNNSFFGYGQLTRNGYFFSNSPKKTNNSNKYNLISTNNQELFILYPQKSLQPELVKDLQKLYNIDGVWHEDLQAIQRINTDTYIPLNYMFEKYNPVFDWSMPIKCLLIKDIMFNEQIKKYVFSADEVNNFRDFKIEAKYQQIIREFKEKQDIILNKFNISYDNLIEADPIGSEILENFEPKFKYELFPEKVYEISLTLFDKNGELIMEKVGNNNYTTTLKFSDGVSLTFDKNVYLDAIFYALYDQDKILCTFLVKNFKIINFKEYVPKTSQTLMLFDLKRALPAWGIENREKIFTKREKLIIVGDHFLVFPSPLVGFVFKQPELDFKLIAFNLYGQELPSLDCSILKLNNKKTLTILYPRNYISQDLFLEWADLYPKIDGYFDFREKRIMLKNNLSQTKIGNAFQNPEDHYNVWKSLVVNNKFEVSIDDFNPISYDKNLFDRFDSNEDVGFLQSFFAKPKLIKYLLIDFGLKDKYFDLDLSHYQQGQLKMNLKGLNIYYVDLIFENYVKLEYTKVNNKYQVKYFIYNDNILTAIFSVDPLATTLEDSIIFDETFGKLDNLDKPFYRIAALVDLRIASAFFIKDI